MLSELVRLRYMIPVFVVRELRENYAGTRLGFLWNIMQPAMMIFLYWWVFGYIWSIRIDGFRDPGAEIPFIIFLLSALLPWLAWSDAVNKSATAVLARADVIKHAKFPALIFPCSRVIATHLVFIPIILLFWIWLNSTMHQSAWCIGVLLGILLLFGLQLVFALGVGLLVASLSVYLRDIPHALSMVLLLLFFTAPILYPLSQVPESFYLLMWLNPFTVFAEGYHYLFLHNTLIPVTLLAMAGAYALSALGIGVLVFKRLQPGFADVI